jgi:hypothetical protein
MSGMGGPPIQIPSDVLALLRRIFRGCNRKVAKSLSLVPTLQEPSLDQELISYILEIAPTYVSASGWVVSTDVHYLGGGHHFGRWEIADVGVIIALRRGTHTLWSKAAILQSKRLFPTGTTYNPEKEADHFRWGFGRLHTQYPGFVKPRELRFEIDSRYESLDLKGEQIDRVIAYEGEIGMPVHYLLYNPLVIPWSRTVPVTPPKPQLPSNHVGCRVLPSASVVALRKFGARKPSFGQVNKLPAPNAFAPFAGGWKLEDFIITLLLGCKEGRLLDKSADSPMEFLFYRRNYPIAVAFAVNIEAPG